MAVVLVLVLAALSATAAAPTQHASPHHCNMPQYLLLLEHHPNLQSHGMVAMPWLEPLLHSQVEAVAPTNEVKLFCPLCTCVFASL